MTSHYDARDAALRGVLIRTTTDDDGRPLFVVLDADGTPSTYSTLADAETAAAISLLINFFISIPIFTSKCKSIRHYNLNTIQCKVFVYHL